MSIQANSLTRVTTVDGNADVILVDPTTNDGTIINAKALANSGTPDGYNDLKSAVRTNTSDITVLKSRADSAASDVSALQSAVAANTTDVAGLQSTVAGHTDDIADLHDEVNEQTMYIRSLASSVPAPVDTAAEMTNYSQIYIYTGSETGYTRGNWYYWNGSAWVSGGAYGGAVTDTSLTQSGIAADAKAVGDAMAGIGAASVPTEVRQAMKTLFQKAAYIEEGLADEVAVITAWAEATTSITVSPATASVSSASPTAQLSAVTTPAGKAVTWSSSNTAVATVSSTGLVTAVGNGTATITATSGTVSASCTVTVTGLATLTGITATYTQSGTVTFTDTLNSLKPDLVVTASYDNSTTAVITDYVLSGTLAEGTSTITVSYGGFTDTFNVTVTHYDTSIYSWDFTQSLTDSKQGLEAVVNGATRDSNGITFGAATDYISLTDVSTYGTSQFTVEVEFGAFTGVNGTVSWPIALGTGTTFGTVCGVRTYSSSWAFTTPANTKKYFSTVSLDAFNNKTLKFVYDLLEDNVWRVYADDVLLMEDTSPYTGLNSRKYLGIAFLPANSVVKKVRVYAGVA